MTPERTVVKMGVTRHGLDDGTFQGDMLDTRMHTIDALPQPGEKTTSREESGQLHSTQVCICPGVWGSSALPSVLMDTLACT